MPNNNKIILGLLALTIVFSAPHASQAQEPPTIQPAQAVTAEQAPQAPKAPIVIEADNLSFSDETGDIRAEGNVVITNQGQKVEAELVNGNAKLSEIWINDEAQFSQPDSHLTGHHTLYNYKLKTGSMENVKGKIGRKYVAGDIINIYPEQYVIDHGSTTNCPAKVPDYHVSADKIEIWPGDQMIAYNAKFWIGNKVIFSLPRYRQSIGEGGESSFPRIGYDSEQGIYIKQHIDYPLTNRLSAYANLDYYTKADFKPSFGIIQREENYSIGVAQGHFLDDDDNWIKKEPEFKLTYHPRQLGRMPVSYSFTAIYGKWTDDDKTSWHQEYELYFRHNPIKLNDTMNLYLGTGIEHIRESYDNSSQNIFKFDATVDKRWSERFNTWVGYHYTKNNETLFEYDSDDLSRELVSGFTYKIDKMNTIGVRHSYDLDNKRVEDVDYTWYRNLHCWQAAITYRAERDQIKFDISTTRW
ncbi:LPS-assembly protein LptD [Sporomusa paucivorans]|uniref:LPS-assembly protein LptD n=1 Tax=Sporomusa paucivorans TaxID=2376 RepID=UPI003571608F